MIHLRAAIGLAAMGFATAALAQQPDSSRPRVYVLTSPPSIEVQAPLFIVVAPSSAPDTLSVRTNGCAAARIASLPCSHLEPGGTIVDRAHAAISTIPPGVVIGYVLAAPRIRPMLIRGVLPQVALQDSIRRFMATYWGLTGRR